MMAVAVIGRQFIDDVVIAIDGSTLRAEPGERHVRGVQLEAVSCTHPSGHLAEQIVGQVLDRATAAALCVQMGTFGTGEVVGRRAVPEVDVLHDSQITEGHQGSVDAGSMDRRRRLRDGGDDFFHRQVPGGIRQRRQDRAPRCGHALALGP